MVSFYHILTKSNRGLLVKGQPHRCLCTVWRILPERHPAAMRGGDLFHHMKPQNVRGLLVLRRALQCRQNGRRIACAIVRDGQAEAISGNIRLHLDLYGCRIMPDAVAQQCMLPAASASPRSPLRH